jgi:hypothetical protein
MHAPVTVSQWHDKAIWRVVDQSMQILGGLGITHDTIVAPSSATSAPFGSTTAPPRSTAGRSPAVLRAGGAGA